MYNFTCTPRVITSYLLSVMGILLTANFFVIHRRIVAPDPVLRGFRAAFYFGADANFPGLFTALLILAVAVTLWKIANITSSVNVSSHYRIASTFFLVLSVDDFFNLSHPVLNITGQLFQQLLKASPAAHFLLAVLFAVFVLLLLLTAIKTLPVKHKIRLLIAMALYFIGSAARSFLNRQEPVEPKLSDVFNSLGQTAAQLLEMTAILYLLHGLLHYYLSNVERADVTFSFFASQPDTVDKDNIEDLSLKS